MNGTRQCRPHAWLEIQEGDVELECERCGRILHMADITPNMLASIVNAREARYGSVAGDRFAKALYRAKPLAAKERLERNASVSAQPPPSPFSHVQPPAPKPPGFGKRRVYKRRGPAVSQPLQGSLHLGSRRPYGASYKKEESNAAQ